MTPGRLPAVASFLTTISGPIVLVGHSHGGAVITNVAAGNPNVKALVYVDAAAPDVGETNGSFSGADSILKQKPESELFDRVPYSGAPAGAVDPYLKKDVFLQNFGNALPADVATRLWATQRSASTSAFGTPSKSAAWHTIPSWYFISSGDQIITPTSGTAIANRAHSKITNFEGRITSNLDLASRRGDGRHRPGDRLGALGNRTALSVRLRTVRHDRGRVNDDTGPVRTRGGTMTTTSTRSSHTASLLDGEIVEESDLGSMRRITADHLPILKGLSVKRVLLNPGAMRTPHWHANANELTYCVSGTALVSILDDGSKFSTFIITAGQMFHAASGSLHHIENVGTDVAEFIIAFRNERPEDFGFGATLGAFSDAVLGNTYGLPATDLSKIRRDTTDRKLAARVGDPEIPPAAYFRDPHKFDVEAQAPGLNYVSGNARFARDQFWPALKDMSMYSLRVTETGMREPHWHPVTAEMGYVQHGDARMTVMNPDGTLDTWTMTTGDMYFIPRAYPHHIENIGTDDWHFLIFFDQPFPADIGYRASASAYSREVLAAAFNTHIDDLPEFPFTPADPLIVSRINPVD